MKDKQLMFKFKKIYSSSKNILFLNKFSIVTIDFSLFFDGNIKDT